MSSFYAELIFMLCSSFIALSFIIYRVAIRNNRNQGLFQSDWEWAHEVLRNPQDYTAANRESAYYIRKRKD